MASTSASSIQKSFKYDVFLSFRGEDTRKNFVDNLYHALKHNGIYTYKDDQEIKKGKRISDELINSIQDSKFYIIVFSKNYASSSWCLDELVKIMECQRTNEQTAYPVFYDVEPTEIRNQSGVVREAFAKHVNEEATERWRDAMKEAAGLAGWELKNTFDGHEAKLIQKIVEEISQELRFINYSVNEKLVGMETRVKGVVSSLETDIYDVRMIGIKGMGGAGKTTLARVVFDQISFRFEGSSFVENVRENSKNLSCGLKSLQKQVLSDVLKTKDITINGVHEGKILMKQRMCCKKVLVVLDDVDHIDQLEALAGELSWFKPGSRVIITTREEQVLVGHGVPMNMILDVNLLSYEEANCLFNRYAFGREAPKPSYQELSGQVVRYAAGLPLTIKVLGSFLRGKDELEWTDALERLKTIPLRETQEILEISYNSLEEDYKEIFLDVACILKGWDKEKAILALESCGLHARSGLRVLEQKSLITISNYGCLGMHDHIEEMGKNIVRRSYPNTPYRHSRLWIGEEIEDILVEDRGAEATRCIISSLDPNIIMKGLWKMKELRFVRVQCEWLGNLVGPLDEDSIHLPNSLRYISWENYPYTSLPRDFLGNNLVSLHMHRSNLRQLWKGGVKKVLKKLKFIDLRFCDLRTFDIGLTMNLEKLWLHHCSHLIELLMPVENPWLKGLSLEYCCKLKTLNLTGTRNIETLKLIECKDLVELHMPVELIMLKDLQITGCWELKTLNLMGTQNIEILILTNCKDFVELHMPVENIKLKYLQINKCCKLKTLNLTQTQNIETLTLINCKDLVELQMHVENIKLKDLQIIDCWKLKTLNLTENQNIKTLKLINCKNLELQTLNLTENKNIETLKLINCKNLVELQMPVENIKLKDLQIIDCWKLKTLNLMGTQNIVTLILTNCMDLVELRMPVKNSKLRTLDLGWVGNLNMLNIEGHKDLEEFLFAVENIKTLMLVGCSKLKTINLTWTWSLERLTISNCEDLEEIVMPVEGHEVNIIRLSSSKLKTLNLTRNQNLKELDLSQCEDLLELHMPIESPKLKFISIGSSKLRTLYLGSSPYLECLDLHRCYNLVEIHARIGCLSGRVMLKPCLVNQGFPLDDSLAELHIIARSLGICPLHPHNNLPKFHFECNYKDLLLSSAQNLAELVSFGPCACANLASLSGICCGVQLRKLTLEGGIPEVPKDIDQLKCLEELRLLSTEIEHFPDSICMLKHLKFLQFKSCRFLKQLPEDIGRLECLEELHLTDCTSLRDIPNSICEMKHLECLYLTNCILVEKLPKEIGRLQCLKELNIDGTGITDLPSSIDQLKDLVFKF